MSKAFAKKLKSIYTSGDNYTVLTLLEKLLKEFEDFSTGLYRHTIKANYLDGAVPKNYTFTVIDEHGDEYTVDDSLSVGVVVGGTSASANLKQMQFAAISKADNGMVLTFASIEHNATSIIVAYNVTSIEDTVEEIL